MIFQEECFALKAAEGSRISKTLAREPKAP
jgi:hypothetical protein